MFAINLPRSFKVGDTVDCRINGGAAKVTWRDIDHLIIEPDDTRVIIAVDKGGGLTSFTCGDAGGTRADYGIDAPPELGGAFIVHTKTVLEP